jgi:hypothetical protein
VFVVCLYNMQNHGSLQRRYVGQGFTSPRVFPVLKQLIHV